ncbi:MAG: uncharacterized protein JWM93_3169 [Frankiales bacterium]|nr:uncharacterized protein [Frankiales bacterium]
MSAERTAEYAPGNLLLVCGPTMWLLADVSSAAPVVRELMDLARREAGIDDILDAVTRSGLRALPRFALLHTDGDAGVAILRGPIGASVVAADGRTLDELLGSGARGWHEFAIDEEAAVVVLHTVVAPGAAHPLLPITVGAALASSVHVTLAAIDVATVALASAAVETVSGAATNVAVPASIEQTLHGYGANLADESPAQQVTAATPGVADVVGLQDVHGGAESPAAGAAVETPYDHLFEATQHRTVEGAAVRLPVETPSETPAVRPPSLPAGLHVSMPPVSVPTAPSSAATPGMIDSVPWLSAPVAPVVPVSSGPPVAADPPVRSAAQSGDDELDGATVSRAHLRALLDTGSQAANESGFAAPVVHAVVCSRGHLNPPQVAECRVCTGQLDEAEPFTIPRPVLGVLRLSTGDVVTLDRGVVMGRSPRTEWSGEGERPHVVRLPSPTQDISRTHVRITLDGWHVLVADLSTNGTLVTLPGKQPQRLHANQPTLIPLGTVVDLSDTLNFRYEVGE